MRISDWSSDVCSSDLWSEDWAILDGVRTKLQVAHFKLSHSRAFSARATRDDRPAFAGIGTTRAFFGEFAPCIMIDEQVHFAPALRDRYETNTFLAERGPARDLGQGLCSKPALHNLRKAAPSLPRTDQENTTPRPTPHRP